MKILFKNAKILNLENTAKLDFGNVVVTNNIISYVGKDIPNESFDKTIDVNGNILMPGFVDTHCHSPMTILRSLKDDAKLDDWLFNNMIPAESELTPKDIYWGEKLPLINLQSHY